MLLLISSQQYGRFFSLYEFVTACNAREDLGDVSARQRSPYMASLQMYN